MRTGVLVIGGGQAGLAMGYHLAQRGIDHTILDAGERIGGVWRGRWDSLTLFTPARYSALPGMDFPGDPEAYPGKNAVADYLEAYASRFSLPVRSGERAVSLRGEPGGYEVEVRQSGRRYEARQIVVATGPFQHPFIPAIAQDLVPDVVQLHSSDYRGPAQIPPGSVLVVGGGNSGVQIAEELSRTHRVHLSVGTRMPRLPQRVLGRSVFWWLEGAGLLDVDVQSRLGRRMSRTETLIGSSPAGLRRHGVDVRGRMERASGVTASFADRQSVLVESVVWATGFRPDYSWLDVPVLDPGGVPIHRRGISAVPGLHFLGLPWLHTRGSALIGWVGRDAAHLADAVAGQC
jgi:putative flavoprotein involved in K+ transport